MRIVGGVGVITRLDEMVPIQLKGDRMKKRNATIDAIKGLAIVAVVLYHFGGNVLPYGYLGVDVFFVVGGFLLIGSLKRRLEEGSFEYRQFVLHKLIRLWPSIVIASSVAVCLGYFLMLPDDYENLAESVVASNVFSNNVLQCITIKNYWDVVNHYKPLMHLWYIGVLMQAYITIPIVYIALYRARGNSGIKAGTALITALSLLLFAFPVFPPAWKFYYLPFRLFEITAGGLLVFYKPALRGRREIGWISIVVLLMLICSHVEVIPGSVMLVGTVMCTVLVLWSASGVDAPVVAPAAVRALAGIGRRSYSIYIWHQVVIAFLFYSCFARQSLLSFAVCIGITAAAAILSYRFTEIPLGACIGDNRMESRAIAITAVLAAVTCGISLQIYLNAGVVRDVPELGITRDDAHRNMHAEYCDRPYDWDRDFTEDAKTHVLVLGNSFGRDWANILHEFDPSLDISYCFYTRSDHGQELDRVEDADIVFYVMGPGYETVPEGVREIGDKLRIVGNKNYGESNGIIYAHRFFSGYYEQTVDVAQQLKEQNRREAETWGDRYIDLLGPVTVDGKVRVFTDDNMLISQDCRHLTQAGAQYYARILDLDAILEK
jgi:peptidoglycan/LPS O-acetylase OafA/YrhL